jgi:hypothetical protein
VVVFEGLTGLEIVVVRAASLYQMVIPVAQVAASVELCPEQIVAGFADTPVGAEGVMLVVDTFIVVFEVQPLASVAVMVYAPDVRVVNVPAGLCEPTLGEIE